MALSLKEWREVLNVAKDCGRSWFKLVKEKLKDKDPGIYEEWRKSGFSISYQLPVVNNAHSFKADLSFFASGKLKNTLSESTNAQHICNDLLSATISNKLRAVKRLIKKGADLNVKSKTSMTPLHWAAKCNHKKIVKFFIKVRANLNVLDNIGRTPLHLAVIFGHVDIVKALIHAGANVNSWSIKKTPLHLAAENGHLGIVKALIYAGANVNLQSKKDMAPLHLAARAGHIDVVRALINAGADVDLQSNDGNTPLFFADERDHIGIAELIVNHIAKLEIAGFHVSERNLQKKNEFIDVSDKRRNNYSQHSLDCKKEVKKIEKGNKPLYDFLKESNVDQLVSIWENNENLLRTFNDQEGLQRQYPEYTNILINKANEVKKEILLHNTKPLIDALSTRYGCNIRTMTFASMQDFFKVLRGDFGEELTLLRNSLN